MIHFDKEIGNGIACGIKWKMKVNTTTVKNFVTCKRCLKCIKANEAKNSLSKQD